MTGADTGIEGRGDALHVVEGLRFVGGGNGDDAPTNLGVAIKKPGEDVGLDFVLAGLAGEDDDKGETYLVKDRFFDGKGDAALVGTEIDATGGSPTDGITTDGLADTEGEEGGKRGHMVGKGWQARVSNTKRDGTFGHPLPGYILERMFYNVKRQKKKCRLTNLVKISHIIWRSCYERTGRLYL